jgi:glycosyltransferase involved in cell wall biosynthesis
VEAMFAKVPIIATNVGGVPYVTRDGYESILVSPNSPVQIANALEKLHRNIGLRKKLSMNGYLRAQEKFSSQRYIADINTLYRGVLKV